MCLGDNKKFVKLKFRVSNKIKKSIACENENFNDLAKYKELKSSKNIARKRLVAKRYSCESEESFAIFDSNRK